MEKKHPLKLHASRVFSIADPNTYSYYMHSNYIIVFFLFMYFFQSYVPTNEQEEPW
jgi:hypothetical protein